MFEYEEFLIEQLNRIKNELGADVNIQVSTEQAFAKKKTFLPNTIYCIIKYLSSDLTYGAKVQPIQIVCSSEQNSLDISRMIFGKFTEDFNFFGKSYDGTFVKHQYSTPVVLSNFEEVGYGYRSALYFTGNLTIMENVVDVSNLMIDGVSILQTGFSLSYSMSTNSQQRAGDPIASSVKSSATLSITLTIPFLSNTVTTKIIDILAGTNTGNENFTLNFNLGSTPFENLYMKLISAQMVTSPDQVPALQIGLQR